MSGPLWHDGPLLRLAWDGEAPVAWRVAHGSDDRQARRAERRGLACELIARLSGVEASDVRLGRDEHGAPVVLWPEGWHLGLSSRGNASLIGVARQPVAVDRELTDDAPPLWDMLTDTEVAQLRLVPVTLQPRAWVRRWTIKEAHAKLVGEPRRIAPDTIETRLFDATRATASFEGRSLCWTREEAEAIETLAVWAEPHGR